METNLSEQNQNNQETFIKAKNSKKPILVFSVIIFLILAVFGVLLYHSFIKQKAVPAEQVKNSPEQTLTSEQLAMQKQVINTSQELGTLMSLSPITFPKVVSQGEATSTNLAEQFKNLILLDAQNLEIQYVGLSNGQSGFKLIYDVPRGIADITPALPLKADKNITARASVKADDWKKLNAVHSDFAGVIILENSYYQAEILETYLSAYNTHVIVLLVKK